MYFIEICFENNLFKIFADENGKTTKVLEMPSEDGQLVLNEIFNNDIHKLVNAIFID